MLLSAFTISLISAISVESFQRFLCLQIQEYKILRLSSFSLLVAVRLEDRGETLPRLRQKSNKATGRLLQRPDERCACAFQSRHVRKCLDLGRLIDTLAHDRAVEDQLFVCF